MDNYYVEIVQFKDKVVKSSLGPMSEHKAYKVARGANINLDQANFFTRIITKEQS